MLSVNEEIHASLMDAGLDVLGVSAYDDETMERMDELAAKGLKLVLLDQRPEREAAFVENRGGNIELRSDETRRQADMDWTSVDCLRPSTAMNIHPNGDVSLCCGDLYGDVVLYRDTTSRASGSARNSSTTGATCGPGGGSV